MSATEAGTGDSSDWVSASEIAAYAYCARAYWLERVQQIERPKVAEGRLAHGGAEHRRHGRRVRWQRRLIRGAVLVLVVSAILILLTLRRPGGTRLPGAVPARVK